MVALTEGVGSEADGVIVELGVVMVSEVPLEVVAFAPGDTLPVTGEAEEEAGSVPIGAVGCNTEDVALCPLCSSSLQSHGPVPWCTCPGFCGQCGLPYGAVP